MSHKNDNNNNNRTNPMLPRTYSAILTPRAPVSDDLGDSDIMCSDGSMNEVLGLWVEQWAIPKPVLKSAKGGKRGDRLLIVKMRYLKD